MVIFVEGAKPLKPAACRHPPKANSIECEGGGRLPLSLLLSVEFHVEFHCQYIAKGYLQLLLLNMRLSTISIPLETGAVIKQLLPYMSTQMASPQAVENIRGSQAEL